MFSHHSPFFVGISIAHG